MSGKHRSRVLSWPFLGTLPVLSACLQIPELPVFAARDPGLLWNEEACLQKLKEGGKLGCGSDFFQKLSCDHEHPLPFLPPACDLD